ncbi:DNA-directed RNA polymerase, mitochondrial [Engraulis encrasicolus]|uniref:DNA-directed RNA polymerase, mitochondrial n=1 Tax=Engraulis encrasicolus TaxID=184585 RepID=UPI002FD53373
MSLLRLCAFSSCLKSSLIIDNTVRYAFNANHCLSCLRIRGNIGKRVTDTTWVCRRRYTALIPKKEEGRNRLRQQCQLVDVLEARIQQLQSDVTLGVKHSNVQFAKAPQTGRGSASGKGSKHGSGDKGKAPKSGQARSSGKEDSSSSTPKAHNRRWMEKLQIEKWDKSRKQVRLQQKLQNKETEQTPGSAMLPGTSKKTISTAAKKSKGKSKVKLKQDQGTKVKLKQDDGTKTKAHPPPPPPPPPLPSPPNRNAPRTAVAFHEFVTREEELAEVEELDQQVNQWAPTSPNVEKLLEDKEGNRYEDAQLSLRCFLEASVFIGDADRAQRCLNNHHNNITKRKLLSMSAYNIMLRVWAKKGTVSQIGRLFAMIEEAGLKPNLSSYAAALECMGRQPSTSSHVINRCLLQMEENGLSVDDLFKHTVFRRDEREMVLSAVQVMRPGYQPSTTLDQQICPSPLVQDFYEERATAEYPKLAFSVEDLRQRFSQQLAMEGASTVTIDSVEALKPVTPLMAKMRDLLASQKEHWRTSLLKALRESKMVMSHSDSKSWKINLYPYLRILDDKEYVDAMLQCMANLPPSGETLLFMARELGSRIQNKFCIRQKVHSQMVDKLAVIYSQYVDLLAEDRPTSDLLPREQWVELEAELSAGPSLLYEATPWPNLLLIQLGTFLVDLMVRELKLPSDLLSPAPGTASGPGHSHKLLNVLYHMYTFRGNRQIGFIKPHPILTQLKLDAMETHLTFDSYMIPMLCPPVPWTSPRFGAYLLTPTKLMRSPDGAVQHQLMLEKCHNRELHAVLDSLNQLGNCAWRINQPLLDTVVSIFNDKGDEKLDVPPPVSEAPEVPRFRERGVAFDAAEKAALKREALRAKKRFAEMHSLRMDALYKLSIAHYMRDQVFWFPHNMDFRGRTYPCPPYFNHLGSDVTRAILVFAEGKALGPQGLDWLKIHLVNLTGLKKRSSLDGRLAYANSIMEDILDSADRPLTGRKWWMNADEPWQTLACCMEIANASQSPDPAKFVSHFPVHQDGSCNGLQHYAALGRDVIGATSVNLMPCDEPQDVYSGVAQQVEEFRARDAQNGLRIAQVLEGYISRKVVKQTVMTVVYGVTRYGGRLQIEKRLKEIDDFPEDQIWEASLYLVQQVFSGLKEMFTGTREIQDWLTESARLIAKSGSTVEWVTPLGLPIVQPYHRIRTQTLKSNIQLLNLQISHDASMKPDTVKQKNAFPPNFIHSLDSTHMMLTSLYCYRAGLTFVSVHDCFWTHAVTVNTMNKICREQFVALHSQPIMQDLSKFLLQKYCSKDPGERKNKKFMEYRRMMQLLGRVPETGDFNLERVKESTFFFS